MKKVLFTAALALVAVVASAQEPNFPMMGGGFGGFGGFGGQQQTNVKFDEYVAQPVRPMYIFPQAMTARRSSAFSICSTVSVVTSGNG